MSLQGAKEHFSPSQCVNYTIPSDGYLIVNRTLTIPINQGAHYYPNCPGSGFNHTLFDSLPTTLQSRMPFFASTVPQMYTLGMMTVIAYLLLVILFITPRTFFVGGRGGGASFLGRRGMISGSYGSSSVIGIGGRPWLQKLAVTTVVVSLSMASADTFNVAQRQYSLHLQDSSMITNEVLRAKELRAMRVVSNTALWLAQVQTLIRLFPRHREKVIIKWFGFALIVLDIVFTVFNNFDLKGWRDDNPKPKPGGNNKAMNQAIPALAYLFEGALSLLYAACVMFYALCKHRFAFFHMKMKNICLVAILSLAAIVMPVIFFVLDISQHYASAWGTYVRWVSAAAASVVVWEWVERIEALERDEKNDGVLGREVFDEDDMFPSADEFDDGSLCKPAPTPAATTTAVHRFSYLWWLHQGLYWITSYPGRRRHRPERMPQSSSTHRPHLMGLSAGRIPWPWPWSRMKSRQQQRTDTGPGMDSDLEPDADGPKGPSVELEMVRLPPATLTPVSQTETASADSTVYRVQFQHLTPTVTTGQSRRSSPRQLDGEEGEDGDQERESDEGDDRVEIVDGDGGGSGGGRDVDIDTEAESDTRSIRARNQRLVNAVDDDNESRSKPRGSIVVSDVGSISIASDPQMGEQFDSSKLSHQRQRLHGNPTARPQSRWGWASFLLMPLGFMRRRSSPPAEVALVVGQRLRREREDGAGDRDWNRSVGGGGTIGGEASESRGRSVHQMSSPNTRQSRGENLNQTPPLTGNDSTRNANGNRSAFRSVPGPISNLDPRSKSISRSISRSRPASSARPLDSFPHPLRQMRALIRGPNNSGSSDDDRALSGPHRLPVTVIPAPPREPSDLARVREPDPGMGVDGGTSGNIGVASGLRRERGPESQSNPSWQLGVPVSEEDRDQDRMPDAIADFETEIDSEPEQTQAPPWMLMGMRMETAPEIERRQGITADLLVTDSTGPASAGGGLSYSPETMPHRTTPTAASDSNQSHTTRLNSRRDSLHAPNTNTTPTATPPSLELSLPPSSLSPPDQAGSRSSTRPSTRHSATTTHPCSGTQSPSNREILGRGSDTNTSSSGDARSRNGERDQLPVVVVPAPPRAEDVNGGGGPRVLF